MKTDEERVRFALRLCELRLERLSDGALDALEAEVKNFLDWAETPDDWKDKRNLSMVAALDRIQNSLRRELLYYVLECRRTEAGVDLTAAERRAAAGYRYAAPLPDALLLLAADASGLARVTLATPSVEAQFFFALAVAIRGVDSRRLRQCPACAALFMADDNRQIFCSKRCGNRTRLQAARTAHRPPVTKTPTQQRLEAIFFPPALR